MAQGRHGLRQEEDFVLADLLRGHRISLGIDDVKLARGQAHLCAHHIDVRPPKGVEYHDGFARAGGVDGGGECLQCALLDGAYRSFTLA